MTTKSYHKQMLTALLLTLLTTPAIAADTSQAAPPSDAQSSSPSLIDKFDKNGDGFITRDEFPESDERFKALDKNGDGKLDAREVPPMPIRDNLHFSMEHQGAKGPQGGPGGGPQGGPPPGKDMFKQDDKNGDGKLSRDEFSGPSDLFDKLDTNKDGYLSKEEATPKGGPDGGGEPPSFGGPQ